MMQQTPSPVPDHGTGWGLLFLFVALYAVVAVLGAGTLLAFALRRFDREVPRTLRYLVVAPLFGALLVSGFAVLVAATAGRWDVVGLLALVVFLPLAVAGGRSRGPDHGWVEVLSHAGLAWSLPFLAGFGVIAFVGTRGGPVTPEAAGVIAAVVVLAGTVVVERLPFFPDPGPGGE